MLLLLLLPRGDGDGDGGALPRLDANNEDLLLALRERCLILEGLITFSRVIGEDAKTAEPPDGVDGEDGVEDDIAADVGDLG